MMTLDELYAVEINSKAAELAFNQSEKRIEDLLSAKSAFETKATALLGVYTTIAVALFTAAWTVSFMEGFAQLAVAVWLSGLFFLVGSIFYVLSFRSQAYALMGVDPEMWLRKTVIDGDDSAVARNLTYIAHFHAQRIATSLASNRRKSLFIELGIWTGALAPLPIFLLFLFHLPR